MKIKNETFETLIESIEFMVNDAYKKIENLKYGKFSKRVFNAKYTMLRQKYGEIRGMMDFLYCTYTDDGKSIIEADDRAKNLLREQDNLRYEINSLD